MRPEAFMAIVSALVSNSLEWASDRPPRISATVATDPSTVEIVFSDNGRGVLPTLRHSLFEPMVSGRPDGSGMGLTLARHIVTGHGGTIRLVTDRRRAGAAFEIRLPRKRPRATAIQP